MGIDVKTNYSMGKAEHKFFISKLLPIRGVKCASVHLSLRNLLWYAKQQAKSISEIQERAGAIKPCPEYYLSSFGTLPVCKMN